MFIVLEDVLTPEEFRALRPRVEQARFVAGDTTAGEGSRGRKHNLQIAENDPGLPEFQGVVLQALARHSLFQFVAVPKHVLPPMFNRYDVGMEYQEHVDFSLVGKMGSRIRTDLSMTLFLSAPEEYDGGELVVAAQEGARSIKLGANQAIVYPSGQLHRANPVTRGTRLAAVTTIQSFIREESRRALLVDVMTLARAVQDMDPHSDASRLANKIHANLLRQWAE
ncbi:MAG: Fe2+-dependent dioxygenase [Rhodanobacteraceae bacterium]